MRIAVVGARGQLGAAVLHECSARHEAIAFSRSDFDLTDDLAVSDALTKANPDAIINCAAYNRVDDAEKHPIEALNVNAFAVRAVAHVASRIGAVLVHYSSDFVFDGTASSPYTEEDRPNPQSFYAASKLFGEWFSLDCPRAYVLRVESLFGSAAGAGPAKGSVASIADSLLRGGAPKVFADRTVSATYVLDGAWATLRLIETKAPYGLYHCVNTGSCTWVELAETLARELGVEPRVTPFLMADATFPAARPLYSALSNEKLRSVGIAMPSWKDAVARYAEAIKLRSVTRLPRYPVTP
jgi:dTDP-4-dehydrorhamnose reductase